MIDIEVDDREVRGKIHDAWHKSEKSRARKGKLNLTQERRDTINLLAKLLHQHIEIDKDDTISDDLYQALLRAVGQELFSVLFVGDLRGDVAQKLAELEDGEIDLLRIKLLFGGSEQSWLASLPWEYVRIPPGDEDVALNGAFLSKRAELVLSRRLTRGVRRELGDDCPLPVLLVCPNPTPPEGVEPGSEDWLEPAHPGNLVDRLKKAEKAGVIKLHELVEDPPEDPDPDYEWVTRDRLRTAMKERPGPVLVHFVGHGRRHNGRGELLFSKSDGTRDWVSDERFADIVGLGSALKLVFLQACESALPDPYVSFSGVAASVAARGLPAVVAMQYRINADIATEFAKSFYDSLLDENAPVDLAVERGREAIEKRLDESEQFLFGLPVLYLSSHNGIARREPLQPMPGGGGVERNDLAKRECPRCRTMVRAKAVMCRECELRFRCHSCDLEYLDPVTDKVCDECGESVVRKAYQADADKVAEVEQAFAVSEDSAAARVVSILQPGR